MTRILNILNLIPLIGFLLTLISLQDLQTALDSSGAITDYGKIQYLCTLLRGGSLHEFETLLENIGHTTNKNLNRIILGLGTYFFPINYPSEKNHTMWCGMRKQSELKVRQYAAYLIKTNGYFIFSGFEPKTIVDMEINNILSRSIPN